MLSMMLSQVDQLSKTMLSQLAGLLVAVMDTPQFQAQQGTLLAHLLWLVDPIVCMCVTPTLAAQRLNHVQQLGGCSYVYPSATHTRKEHSIGVSHLAGMMVGRQRSRAR